MRTWLGSALLVSCLALTACGGGGGGGGGDDGSGDGGTSPSPANPDIVLLLVSGHQGLLDSEPSKSYLHEELGPVMVNDLEDSSYTVEAFYFVDHQNATDYPGYAGLVDRMKQVRDEWVVGVPAPTRVVVVAHSHGGVWATAAEREVGDLPITAHVALDQSSNGWGLLGHDTSAIGGSPIGAYEIRTLVSCPSFPSVPSEQTFSYDLEDVVMPSVLWALEVRSADFVLLERFDDRWNARLDGSLGGLFCYYSGGSHTEVRETTGSTYPFVIDWLRDRL